MTVHVYVYENTETTLWFESLVVCEGGPWRLLREYDKEIPDPVGPGGTTDYNQLNNKPLINSVTLSGNKTSQDLKIEGSIPPGGTAGQVLTKKSATDGDADWETPTGGATSWDQITGKPTDLVQDPAYVHTDNNFTTTEKDQIAANVTAIADRYTKEQTDALLTNKADQSALLALQNQAEDIRLAGEATQAELTEFKGDIAIDLGGIVERLGTHFEVGAEKWYGTYTADGVTYQVYSKLLDIGALPSAAGATQYPHGITGINQILQISGFTNDGFIMNAPRQNAQDNISIYQVQKSGNIVVEVGKDRSSKTGFVMLIYAKNN